MGLIARFSFLGAQRPTLPWATCTAHDDGRLTAPARAFVAARELHGRVPAVYPDSAIVLVLLVSLERGMNNLRGIRGGTESESHPLRHFFSFI
jgi:hypothetical protein